MKLVSVSLSTILASATMDRPGDSECNDGQMELLLSGQPCPVPSPNVQSQTPDALAILMPKLCFRRYLSGTTDSPSDASDTPFCHLTPFGRVKIAVPFLFATTYKAEAWGMHRFADVRARMLHGKDSTAKEDLVFLCESTEIRQVLPVHLEAWRTRYPGCVIILDDGQQMFVLFKTGQVITL